MWITLGTILKILVGFRIVVGFDKDAFCRGGWELKFQTVKF